MEADEHIAGSSAAMDVDGEPAVERNASDSSNVVSSDSSMEFEDLTNLQSLDNVPPSAVRRFAAQQTARKRTFGQMETAPQHELVSHCFTCTIR